MDFQSKNRLGEAADKVPELKDKKNILVIVAAACAAGVIILIAFVMLLISIVFAPLEKAKQIYDTVVEEVEEKTDEVKDSVLEFFERYKNLYTLKGFYTNEEVQKHEEAKFYDKISKLEDCNDMSKEKVSSLILATLFYDNDYSKTLRENETEEPELDDKDITDETKDDSEDTEYIDYAMSTKKIKPLYKEACKGEESYKQFLVGDEDNIGFIPQYYDSYLSSFSDKDARNNEIVKIADEIMGSANEYLIFATGQGLAESDASSDSNGSITPIVLGNDCNLSEKTWKELGNPFEDNYCAISSCFYVYGGVGDWTCKKHAGGSIDIVSSSPNAEVHAIADGVVFYTYDYGKWSCYNEVTELCNWEECGGRAAANYVTIRSEVNGQTIEHSYFHLSAVYVEVGSNVKKGQVIGLVGNTGCSAGEHLDFRFSVSGQACNPERLMQLTGCDISTIRECEQQRKECGY